MSTHTHRLEYEQCVNGNIPFAVATSPPHFSLLAGSGVTMAAMETERRWFPPPELYLPKPFFLSSPPLCPCFLGLFRRNPLLHTNDVLPHLHTHTQPRGAGGGEEEQKGLHNYGRRNQTKWDASLPAMRRPIIINNEFSHYAFLSLQSDLSRPVW